MTDLLDALPDFLNTIGMFMVWGILLYLIIDGIKELRDLP